MEFAAGSVFGLKPCDTDVTCGFLEITFLDDSQEGWLGGAFEVFSSEYGLYASIDFNGVYFQSLYPFYQTKVFVPVNAGELDFAVSEPMYYADLCGYIVQGPGGELLVDESSPYIAPQSVEGIVACDEGDDSQCNATFDVDQATTVGGIPIAGSVDITIYDYNINATYAWDFGDEGTSDDPFASWTYNTDGPYNLCLTVTDDAAGCSDTYCQAISVDSLGLLNGFLSGFTINVIDGGESGSINSVNEANLTFADATVYPNPAQDWFMINGVESNTIWTGRLFDVAGNAVRDFNGTGSTLVDVSNLPRGLYLMQLSTNTAASKPVRVVIQ